MNTFRNCILFNLTWKIIILIGNNLIEDIIDKNILDLKINQKYLYETIFRKKQTNSKCLTST